MPMLDPSHPLAELLRKDRRYKLDAYVFVFEALKYAQDHLGPGEEKSAEGEAKRRRKPRPGNERHLTGQELCEAIRRYALEQYGYLAKTVFNSWGVFSTRDFGEIVFRLIEIGQMKKTKEDKLSDFDDVFDFDADLTNAYQIGAHE
jgi:uncharacterized repeat protein (TIGR04138 family)